MARRPTIVQSTPKNFAVDVDATSSISVEFDMDMDSRYFENSVMLSTARGEAIPGRITYRKKVLTFIPLSPLDKGIIYVLTITGDEDLDDEREVGVRNIVGDALAGTTTIRFTTDSAGMLMPPDELSPATHVVLKKTPVDFSWEKREGAFKYELQISKSNGFSTLVFPKADSTLSIFSNFVTPDIDYEDGIYYWRVRAVGDYSKSEWSPVQQFNISTVIEGKISEDDFVDIDLVEDGSFTGIIDVELIEEFPSHLASFVPLNVKNLFFRVIGDIDPSEIDIDSFTLFGTHISGDHEDENHGKVDGTITVVKGNDYTTYIIFSLEPLPIEANEDPPLEEVIDETPIEEEVVEENPVTEEVT